MPCPPGLVWSPEAYTCIPKDQTSKPTQQPATTTKTHGQTSKPTQQPATTTKTPVQTTKPSGGGCYDCKKNNPCTRENTQGKYFYFPHCNSSYFVQCSETEGECFEMPCPPGQVWSPEAYTCVPKGQTSKPTQQPATTTKTQGQTSKPTQQPATTTKTPVQTTQPSGGASDCGDNNPCTAENAANGKFYFPHEDPTKYVQCSEWGQCYIKNCSVGTVWDPDAVTCNWPPTEKPPAGSTAKPPATNTPSGTAKPPREDYDCGENNPCTPENAADGKFHFPHKDPTKFVQCSEWGQCYIKNCSVGLVWDPVAVTCNWPPTEKPPAGSTAKPPATTTRSGTAIPPRGDYDCGENNPCTPENAADGKFHFPHKDPTKFVQCSEFGECWVRPCSPGTVWDPIAVTCNWPPKTESPDTKSTTTTKSQAATTTKATTVGKCYDCDKNNPCSRENTGGKMFYFPACDPTYFVQCSEWNQCWVMPCSPGTVWDPEAYTCNWPSGSKPSTVKTTPRPSGTTSKPRDDYDCGDHNPCTVENAEADKFYFPHKDPTKFVQCSEWGQCWVMPCAPGTVWDPVAYTCNWPKKFKKRLMMNFEQFDDEW